MEENKKSNELPKNNKLAEKETEFDEQYDENPGNETLDLTVDGDEDAVDISNVFTLNADEGQDRSKIELVNSLRHAALHRMIFTVTLIGADYKSINGVEKLCAIGKLSAPFDVFDVYITFESFFTELEKIKFDFANYKEDVKRRRLMEYFGADIEICISRITYMRKDDTVLILGNRPLALSRLYSKFYEKGVWTGRGYGQHKIKVRENSVVKGCRVIRQKPEFIDLDICGVPYTIFTNELCWKFVASSMDVCEIGDLIDVRVTSIRWSVMAKNKDGIYREFDITDELKGVTDKEEIEKIEQTERFGFTPIKLNEFPDYRYRTITASAKAVEKDYTLPVLEEYSKPEKLGHAGETLATVVGMNYKTGRIRMYCEIGYNAVAKIVVNSEVELPGNISSRARRRRDVIPGSKVIFRPYRRSSIGDFMEGDITRVIKR